MYKEGKAAIKYTTDSFLNPEAKISRDISSAFISAIATKKTKVLDATAATGIRGIRYYLETPSKDVTLLEMNKTVFSTLKKNLKFNKIKSTAIGDSIQGFANTTKEKFDVIDLDPFGGATPYIYDLMKISKGGTYLLITVTDTAVLCGADYKACVRLYDARPLHNELCQEVGLRLLIGYVARIAAQFNYGLEVRFSFSYLHYMRIFIKLNHGSKEALATLKQLGYVYYCNKCLNRDFETRIFPTYSNCKLCKAPLEISGKVWLGPIKDTDTVKLVRTELESKQDIYDKKSVEFFDLVAEELDNPFYYSVSHVTKKLGIGSVSILKLTEMLEKKGFNVSRTHMSKNAIKTNAGIEGIKSCVKKLSKG